MDRNNNERQGFYVKSIAQKQRNKNEKRNKSECNKNEWGQYYFKNNMDAFGHIFWTQSLKNVKPRTDLKSD